MLTKFDKIYVIHLAERPYRYESMMTEFQNIGIEEKVEVWWTCKREISNQIGDNIKTLRTSFYEQKRQLCENVYGSVFNCSLEHYTIIKQAYLRGFESILIMEDDISFIKDKSFFEKCVELMPHDYDIVKFHNTRAINRDIDTIKYIKSNFYVHSTLCYALSRRGMQLLIEEYDNFFAASDVVIERLKRKQKCNIYHLAFNNLCKPSGDASNIIEN